MNSDLLYVNAYEVTREYGGPEEGGWWFDLGTPLASVPIDAKQVPAKSCEREVPEGLTEAESAEWDDHGNPCREKCVCTELAPAIESQAVAVESSLQLKFADLKRRSRLSDVGGAEVQIRIEPAFAAGFPAKRPRFE